MIKDMKNTLKTICALILCAAAFACTDQLQDDAVKSVITADVTSINEVAANNPAEFPVSIKSNVNWIVETPEWVTPSTVFGHGDAIITFSFASNYKNETTTTKSRSGEIKISGGGALNGQGAVLVIPVTQLGFTYVDPNVPIGNIPNVEEFIDFLKTILAGNEPTRWTNDSGEVSLEADIDLSAVEYDWTKHVLAVKNANNGCTVEGPSFSGIFNGNGHKITGFNPKGVVLEAGQTFGLFPVLVGATVKDVNLSGDMEVTAAGTADAGMLVGTAYNSTIKDVVVNGTIKSAGSTASQRFAIGAVCGFAYAENDVNTVIENAVSNVAVDFVGGANLANGAGCAMYGGIVGFATTPKAIGNYSVIIKDCTNNGDMKVQLGRCSGILATANSGTTLQGCTNNGDQVNTIANGRLGNIVCNLSYNSHIHDCVNNGDLDATAEGYSGTAGGIFALAGDATSTISGGGNYGTIKTLNTAGKYIGLLWANHNNKIPTEGMVASGRIFVDGVEREINESNYMENVGFMKYPEVVTGITWVAPKN